jgi:hypothetical protein
MVQIPLRVSYLGLGTLPSLDRPVPNSACPSSRKAQVKPPRSDTNRLANRSIREQKREGDMARDGIRRSCCSGTLRKPAATGGRGLERFGPRAALPRALRALAHEAVVIEDRPHPRPSWEPSPPSESAVVLASPATRVPSAASRAVSSGHSRSLERPSAGP